MTTAQTRPALPFACFDLQYNRSTKTYDVIKSQSEFIHPVNGIITDNGPAGFYRAIGMVVAGTLGPSKPAQRAALIKALLAAVGSDQPVDDCSFSSPILPL